MAKFRRVFLCKLLRKSQGASVPIPDGFEFVLIVTVKPGELPGAQGGEIFMLPGWEISYSTADVHELPGDPGRGGIVLRNLALSYIL